MNNNAENDFFGFSKVKWLHLTGVVDKSVRCSCQIFSGFNTPKIIKIGYFLTELFEKIKGGCFFLGGGDSVDIHALHTIIHTLTLHGPSLTSAVSEMELLLSTGTVNFTAPELSSILT